MRNSLLLNDIHFEVAAVKFYLLVLVSVLSLRSISKKETLFIGPKGSEINDELEDMNQSPVKFMYMERIETEFSTNICFALSR